MKTVKKQATIAVGLFALMLTMLIGCAVNPSAGETITKGEPAAFVGQTVTFPVSNAGKTEFNAAIYDIEPFTLELSLPDGWTLEEAAITQPGEITLYYLNGNCWSVVNIYNENRECVGAVGYGIYEKIEDSGDNPMAVYPGLGLGSGYFFDMSEEYMPVKSSGAVSSAVTEVYYSAYMMADMGLPYMHKLNKGILAHNEELLVYIAVEFDGSVLTDSELQDIAQSIDIY